LSEINPILVDIESEYDTGSQNDYRRSNFTRQVAPVNINSYREDKQPNSKYFDGKSKIIAQFKKKLGELENEGPIETTP
jgi:hypothetical protein